jgi:hypothetical protein
MLADVFTLVIQLPPMALPSRGTIEQGFHVEHWPLR